jgi:hypothetical protein
LTRLEIRKHLPDRQGTLSLFLSRLLLQSIITPLPHHLPLVLDRVPIELQL